MDNPSCDICKIPEVICHHYNCLNFLDISITWKQVVKDEKFIWQFQTSNFSKPTDVHAYLHPSSCSSPHLNAKGIAVSKTVGTRLRTIHSNDQELLLDLNRFAGYLISRGYQEHSVRRHLSDMANRSRSMLLTGQYRKQDEFVLPLVTKLHPATTILTTVVKKAFEVAATADPSFQYDDGLGLSFGSPEIVLDILEYFNNFNDKIQWTIPHCDICKIPEVICHHYNCLNFR